MASTDARVIPYKNAAYRVTFPILDADGDLVTGATSLDSEISKDGGTFADCTNEATEIATSSGMYYLDLTSTEMNADTVAVIVKSGNGKTTPIVLYPQEADDIRVSTTHWNNTAVSTPATAGIPDVNVKNIDNDAASASGTVTFPNATLASTTNITAGTVTTATNVTTVNGLAAGVITAASIAADAITDAKVASDVTIASVTGSVGSVTAGVTVSTNNDKTGYGLSSAAVQAIWDAATSALTTLGSIGKKLADWVVGTIDTYTGNTKQTGDAFVRLGAPAGASVSADIAALQADTDNLQTRIPAALVGGRMDSSVGAMAADSLTSAALAASAVTEIADAIRAIAIVHSAGDPANLEEMLGLIKEWIKNKQNVAKGTNTLTLYKNDGVTKRYDYALTDDASNATRGAGA